MSLQEIYELLQLIKSNNQDNQVDQSTLALTLSVEANLMFAKKENQLFYEILLMFALSPSGYLKRHLIEMFDEKWNDCETILLSRNLILSKQIDIGKDTKGQLFSMNEALAKIIKSRTWSEEIESSYQKIYLKLIEILSILFDKKYSSKESIADMLFLYEGNVWFIIEKYKNQIVDDIIIFKKLIIGLPVIESTVSYIFNTPDFNFKKHHVDFYI